MNCKIFLVPTILIILIILIVGLWPFEFKPLNRIQRLPRTDGVLLTRNSIILEEDAIFYPVLLSYNKDNRLTLEIRIKPSSATNNRLSTILCFYDSKNPELFMLAKWKSALILRRRMKHASGDSYHEVGIPKVLFQDTVYLVTVTMDGTGSRVFIDGKESAFFPGFIINPTGEDQSNTRIMIGNDPRVRMPWDGEILGLAFYKSTLNRQVISRHYAEWQGHDYKSLARENDTIALYPMNERSGQMIRNIITNRNNLVIPIHLFAIKKSILTRPWIHFWREATFYIDLAINILGFIPLGFFLPALLLSCGSKRRSLLYAITILTGFITSLSIELIQVCMPARTSSLTDLICNTLGTILGVILFHKACNFYLLKTKKPDESGFLAL